MLVDASQKGDPGWASESIRLLTEFENNEDLFLALDKNGFVLYEYDHNINASMFASAWLKKFAGQFRALKIGPLPRELRAALDQAHFSVPDRRFVQVALVTEVRVIVTRDPDYSPEVQRILRDRANIRVLDASAALQLVRSF